MEHTNSLHEIVLENNIPKLISYLSYLKKNNKINQYINKYNNECKTPLHLAVISGNTRVVKRMLLIGANPDIRDNNEKKPEDLAKENAIYHADKYMLTFHSLMNTVDHTIDIFNGPLPYHILIGVQDRSALARNGRNKNQRYQENKNHRSQAQ